MHNQSVCTQNKYDSLIEMNAFIKDERHCVKVQRKLSQKLFLGEYIYGTGVDQFVDNIKIYNLGIPMEMRDE